MKENQENTTSGCQMMENLWEAAKVCNLDKPGISGIPGRVDNFITCHNIVPLMRLSALKCWEERTKSGTNPYALFTLSELADGTTNGIQSPAMKK